MNLRARSLLAFAVVVGVPVLAALLAAGAGIGTDDRAAETVGILSGGSYQSWFEGSGVPGGEENVPFLFGLQAFLGISVIVGCLWYWRGSRSGA